MRTHLLNCLRQNSFQFFPTTRNEVLSLGNYFISQANIQTQYEKEKLKKSVEISKRVKKHRLMLQKSLTPEQKTERRRKHAALRRMQRKLLPPEKKSSIRAKDKASRRKRREVLSQEKKSMAGCQVFQFFLFFPIFAGFLFFFLYFNSISYIFLYQIPMFLKCCRLSRLMFSSSLAIERVARKLHFAEEDVALITDEWKVY